MAENRDCRFCEKWEECPCGKKGHDNGTSIGYSIGECKDYQPRIDAEVAKGFLEAKKRIEPENSWLYDVAISAHVTKRNNLIFYYITEYDIIPL